MILETTASKPQKQFIMSQSTFPAFVGGFGSGKTHALMLRCLRMLITDGQDQGFYMPTYGLVRDICYPRWRELLRSCNISYRLNAQANYIELLGKRIIFRTLDRPERIVGYEVSHSYVDELDTLPKLKAQRCWEQIIARNRQKLPIGINTVAVGTTPEGFGFVYERWKKKPSESYELITAPTESNIKHLPADYINTLRETYSPELLAAYLDGQFVNLTSGTIYNSYNRNKCKSDETIIDKEPLYIGCDFNVTKQAATIYVIRNKTWHAVDELVDMYDTPDMINIIKSKYSDHKIYMYPDASGRGRSTNNASVSDISLLQQAGFIIRAKPTNPRVRDRIMSANRAFEQGYVKINANKCPRTAECLEQQIYKNGEPDKASGTDHQNDATTYPIAYEFPIVRPVAKVDFSFTN